MKNILGLIFITCSLSTHALYCTSSSNDEQKTIKLLDKGNDNILLEISDQNVKSYLLGTDQGGAFLKEHFALFNHLGVEHTLTISQPIQHCRTRVCNFEPLSAKLGILSSPGLANEYFDCF